MKYLKGEEGFSLLELILGFVIVAIVVTPILSFFVNNVRFHSQSDDRQIAMVVGQRVMEELKTVNFDNLDIYENYTPVENVDFVTTDLANYPGYSASLKINYVEEDGVVDTDLKEISVRAYWTVNEQEDYVTIRTIVSRRR